MNSPGVEEIWTTALVGGFAAADGPAFAELRTVRVGWCAKTVSSAAAPFAVAGVIVARALAKQAGLDPDKDISIVVADESAQTAALLRSRQIDALSQFDTQYALTSTGSTPTPSAARPGRTRRSDVAAS
jgi:hypothetical protein